MTEVLKREIRRETDTLHFFIERIFFLIAKTEDLDLVPTLI
jgi:hypothetical protein